MADGNVTDGANLFGNTNNSSENQASSTSSNLDAQTKAMNDYLKSIDETMKRILEQGANMSQSDSRASFNSREDFRNRERQRREQSGYDNSRMSFSRGPRREDSFLDGFEDQLMESFLGSDFKDKLGDAVNEFADAFGLDLKTIRGDLGRELAKSMLDSDLGNAFKGQVENLKSKAMGNLRSEFEKGLDKYDKAHGLEGEESFRSKFRNVADRFSEARNPSGQSMSHAAAEAASNASGDAVSDAVSNLAGDALSGAGDALAGAGNVGEVLTNVASGAEGLTGAMSGAVASAEGIASAAGGAGAALTGVAGGAGGASTALAGVAGSGAGAALSGVASAAMAVAPELLLVVAATVVLDAAIDSIVESFSYAVEGTKQFAAKIKEVSTRDIASSQKKIQSAEDRMMADVETMVKHPFEILQQAAEEMYSVWDENLRKINGTQGYTKDGLQDLIGSYAERLRNEGLADVVSSGTITENLSKVLDSGLSGYVAEEFAYIATVLGSAIPTEDFFSYASSYASVAGQMIAQGKSEAEAVKYANKQLEAFASNLLYAGRSLAGGFTTGLKDAADLFENSVKIAQSGKSNDITSISGVLASVSAITGSIAPDLATSITDAVVKAATGGNSSDLVALRSLSGVNAGNTEFLNALLSNPQQIFSTLFSNLASYQNMSDGAFMEVAEGLSDVFGISMDSLARVDFNYLANAVANMNVSNTALEDNLKMLASGETTITNEILKTRQVNEYMINEGLAYVLEDAGTRAIQQHMWDEQIAREMTEATFAVELTGSALEFLNGLKNTVDNIFGFLNPFVGINKVIQTIGTAKEAKAQRADVKALLQAVKVGNGRAEDLYNLSTTNKDLNLTSDMVSVLTGKNSAYQTARTQRESASAAVKAMNSPTLAIANSLLNTKGKADAAISNFLSGSGGSRSSSYNWATIGKSQAKSFTSQPMSIHEIAANTSALSKQESADAAAEATKKALAGKLTGVADLMSSTGKDGKLRYTNYEDWKSDATKKVGDWDSALEAAGVSEMDLQNQFQNVQAQQGAIEELARREREDDFWQAGKDFWRADELRVKEFEFWEITMEYQKNELETTNSIFTLLEETTNSILTGIKKELKALHKDWTDYYINYSMYGSGDGGVNAAGRKTYNYSDVERIAQKEKSESYDAVHALAEALNKNIVDLHDPQVQTNAILGRILLVAEAILQQEQSGVDGASLYDTLTGLATGK